MKGQLWEPCPRCDDEPVCVTCGYCERHCKCSAHAHSRQLSREIDRIYPGLLRAVTEHQEDGAREH